MLSLGIESTAHTFGVGVVEQTGNLRVGQSYKILADEKAVYKAPEGSGIHPREASRHHVEKCNAVLEKALSKAKTGVNEIDFVAYSAGPGLGPCLRVGAVVARTLATYYGKPIVPTNHAIGHIELGKFLCNLNDPMVLLISGGHTALTAQLKSDWRIFGETLDLTLGQLVDQLGRFMGLSSPAGPKIEHLAGLGGKKPESDEAVLAFPYTIKGNDVSYSGLLSAAKEVLTRRVLSPELVAFGIQEVAFSILAEATERALSFTGKGELLVTGGVAANQRLSQMLGSMCKARGVKAGVIPKEFAGDCGAQIAIAGFTFYNSSKYPTNVENAFVRQSWRIDQVSL
jgi:N6-L-threonylcarbamoyladenine synthase